MTDKQREALRLADFLEAVEVGAHTTRRLDEAAAELRRLHQSECEAWRHADELEQERKRLSEIIAELVEALWAMLSEGADYGMSHDNSAYEQAHAAIAKTAGVNHDR